ncbi:MAG: hypothetical protein ABSB91_07790 [Sedimentisphaerales bacterium]
MDKSRWISLSIVAFYILFLISGFIFSEDLHNISNESLAKGIVGIIFWLTLSLGCIWYGDELGEGLLGAKYGLVSETSPGWAVQLMGWIFLLMPVGIGIYYFFLNDKS